MNMKMLTPSATTCFAYYESPIGLVEIASTGEAVTSLVFVEERRPEMLRDELGEEAVRQVTEYFEGSRREFDVPVEMGGTRFQRLVWNELLKIPFGNTVSY